MSNTFNPEQFASFHADHGAAGATEGKHFVTATIRAFVKARTGKTFSHDRREVYFFLYQIQEKDGVKNAVIFQRIIDGETYNNCQYSGLASKADGPTARRGHENGQKLEQTENWHFATVSPEFSGDENAKQDELQRAIRAQLAAINAALNPEPEPKPEPEPELEPAKPTPKKATRRAKK